MTTDMTSVLTYMTYMSWDSDISLKAEDILNVKLVQCLDLCLINKCSIMSTLIEHDRLRI